MGKIVRITLEEIGGTIRGFFRFFARFFAMLLPDVAARWNYLAAGLLIAAMVYLLYFFPGETDPAMQALVQVSGAIGGLGVIFAIGWYIATHRPRRLAAVRVATSLGIVVAILVVIGHPVFPGYLKLAGAAYLLVGAVAIARRYIRDGATSTVDQKPLVRGAILALLPFYLVAVVNLFWGVNTTIPIQKGQPWYLMYMHGNYATPNNPVPVGGEDTRPEDLVDEPRYTTGIDGLTFWGYSLQKTTGIAMAPAFEKLYWYPIYGVGHKLLGLEMTAPENFSVGRIQSFHLGTEILENVVAIITTAFFLGVIFELGASVQRKIQTGQADLDLSRDYGVALLSAVNSLSSVAEIEGVKGSWEMMRRIRDRAVDELIQRLADDNPRARAAAALTLGNLRARRAVPALDHRYGQEQMVRVKSAILVAATNLAPLESLPKLKGAIRGHDPVLSRTALALTEELVGSLEMAAAYAAESNGRSGGTTDAPSNGKAAADRNAPSPAPVQHPQLFADGGASAGKDKLLNTAVIKRTGDAEFEADLRVQMQAMLIECLDAPIAAVRVQAAKLLARTDMTAGATVGGALLERFAAKESVSDWHEGALLALGYLAWAPGEPKLIEFAQHKSLPLRRAALRALGGHDGEGSLKLLRDTLAADEPDAGVRLAVFDALGKRGLTAELDVLLPSLRDVNNECKVAAARALGDICLRLRRRGQPIPDGVFVALDTIAGDRQDSLLRDEACFALADIADTRAVETLIRILPDPEAAKALGMLGRANTLDAATATKAVLALNRAAHDTADEYRDSVKRLAPIHALGQFGPLAATYLIEIYNKRPEDRVAASEALGLIGGDAAVEFLLRQFNPRDLISAEFLAPALADTADFRARDALIAALTTGAAPFAAKALGDMRDEVSLRALMAHHDSYRADVRDAVWGALRKFFADPAYGQQVFTEVQRQARVRGVRALSLVRAMYRFAGGLFLPGDGRRADRAPHAADHRPLAEDVLAEFG